MHYSKEELLQRRKDMALLTQQGYSVTAIAKKYGISKQAVSQLLQKAAKEGHKVVLRKCGPNRNSDYEYRPTCKEVGIIKLCTICKKAFKTKDKSVQTCGKACRGELLHKTLVIAKGKGGNWSRYEKVQLTCCNCGNTFERTKYRNSISRIGCGTKNDYCSRKCYHEKSRKTPEVVKSYKGSFWPSLEEYQKNLDQPV